MLPGLLPNTPPFIPPRLFALSCADILFTESYRSPYFGFSFSFQHTHTRHPLSFFLTGLCFFGFHSLYCSLCFVCCFCHVLPHLCIHSLCLCLPSSLSGAGTSGGELEEESWQPPDPELTQKLVAQIEYYLSDENLEHDAFLLKHVRRNKLGFVSVKLLTSFKKVHFHTHTHSRCMNGA